MSELPGWLRWPLLIFGGGMLLLLLLLLAVVLLSERRLNAAVSLQPRPPAIPMDPELFERGRRLAAGLLRCTSCHGEDLGGKVALEDSRYGRFVAPNLTTGPGGVGAAYTDADWVRAIRYGRDPQGRPLRWMPVADYIGLADSDLAALITYLKAIPPVRRELPEFSLSLLARWDYVRGRFRLSDAEQVNLELEPPLTPPRSSPAAYGRYLAKIGGCNTCHGERWNGARIPYAPPDAPPAPNLTPHLTEGLGSWSEEDFRRALRTGRRPDGQLLDPWMPWQNFAHLSDEEVRALWAYLWSLPPLPTAPEAQAKTAR
ncbi:MAG: cytochrome c [Candidatus Poribacteria bacterium]|nr:MAG: cytochrome c [Candidatus Poribacteria bacterium]